MCSAISGTECKGKDNIPPSHLSRQVGDGQVVLMDYLAFVVS
jgi:hypothetical protein